MDIYTGFRGHMCITYFVWLKYDELMLLINRNLVLFSSIMVMILLIQVSLSNADDTTVATATTAAVTTAKTTMNTNTTSAMISNATTTKSTGSATIHTTFYQSKEHLDSACLLLTMRSFFIAFVCRFNIARRILHGNLPSAVAADFQLLPKSSLFFFTCLDLSIDIRINKWQTRDFSLFPWIDAQDSHETEYCLWYIDFEIILHLR